MINKTSIGISLIALMLLLPSMAGAKKTLPLRNTVGKYIQIGAALNDNITWGKDLGGQKVAQTHFNSAEPEDCMKAENIHPAEGVYAWSNADRFVEFCEQNGLTPYGHCLVWHSQAAMWMFKGPDGLPVSRELLIDRMREHIYNVVGRYKGRIKGWDVVNEAVDDEGHLRDTLFCRYIGDDFIKLAFRFAHEADPEAELYINDYSMSKPAKREAYCRIVKELQAEGIRIDGIGMQSHAGIDYPDMDEYEKSIVEFSRLGVKVMITELDMNMLPRPPHFEGADVGQSFVYNEKYDPYKKGLPRGMQELFNYRYRSLFELYYRHRDKIDRINLWNVSDGDSWMNNWPIKGRTAYPTLFDRKHRAKKVVDEINKIFEF